VNVSLFFLQHNNFEIDVALFIEVSPTNTLPHQQRVHSLPSYV